MKPTLNVLAVLGAIFGAISFVCMILAIGTDFWYIIDTSKREQNSSASLSSHSGLWRTCNFHDQCWSFMNPFGNVGNLTYSQRQILNMQGAFIVLLPLSVILLFISGMLGFISVLARGYLLLLMTGTLLLIAALMSLTGICVYMAYSAAALTEAECMSGRKTLEDISISFGWSLVLASVSFVTELSTAVAFLLAANRLGRLRGQEQEI